MKIAITGATGFVGRNLIPLLQDSGAELLLIGRDLSKLSLIFPDHNTCLYEQMYKKISEFDILIHLATLNNDALGDQCDFDNVNFEFFQIVLKYAVEAKIGCFINISSVHVLDENVHSHHAVSKRKAVDYIINNKIIDHCNVYLPLVYGQRWNRSLKILNNIPLRISSKIFGVFSAFKPSVHIERLARFVLAGNFSDDIILTEGQQKNIFFKIAKRMIDLGFALTIIIFFWWLIVFIWLMVRMESSGPGIFAQRRIGLNAQEFTCYKFRTMKQGTIQAGTHEVSMSSITRLGHVLRKSKLDELPQVWNIVRNQMSLVGPRPCLPVQTELIQARLSAGVYHVKPGITGLAQINDVDMSDPIKLSKWDRRYIDLQSLLNEFNIILRTFLGGGRGDRVKAT